jgi:enoyl-CoA hydratase
MNALVTYQCKDGIAAINMDDGKMNVMSMRMMSELNLALDRAVADHAVVVLAGRDGVFSAGFDLSVLAAGGDDAFAMLMTGLRLVERLLSHPTPVVIACSGHALAMGAFLVLSADYRIGADGAFKIGTNEVAIGLTMPMSGIEICRQRLATAYFNRAVINAEIFTPSTAVAAGFLDRVVSAAELSEQAHSAAVALAKLDMAAYSATKLRVRAQTLQALALAIESDDAAFRSRAM